MFGMIAAVFWSESDSLWQVLVMKAFHRHHSFGSAFKRVLVLVDGVGVITTAGIFMAEIDDEYFRSFDRGLRIMTSGYISLRTTSFDPARLKDALAYRPVNAWALYNLLDKLDLPKSLRFADLGCGLGRACIIAADHGFKHVTGVDLAADLCAKARENIAVCRGRLVRCDSVEIVHADALDYCARSVDDVFFMYCPFSIEFFQRVLNQLADNASRLQKPLTLLYSENVMLDSGYVDALEKHSAFRKQLSCSMMGFQFHVYQCGSMVEGDLHSDLKKPMTTH